MSPFQSTFSVSSSVAISAQESNYYNNISQDVPIVNTSAATSSSLAPRNNGPITDQVQRPRVFSTTQDLAAHYGIPQNFPPAPRTTPAVKKSSSPLADFQSLKASYLNMLASKPADNSTTNTTTHTMAAESTSEPTVTPADLLSPVVPAGEPAPAEDVQRYIENIIASPEFQALQSFDAVPPASTTSDFMTSPLIPDDSPYDDFATSPYDDSPFSDFLTTPVIQDSGDVAFTEYDSSMSLFGGMTLYNPSPLVTEKPLDEEVIPPPPKIDNLDGLYTLSPEIPMENSLEPASLYASPRLPSTPAASHVGTPAPNTRRKSSATGTRKNITPASLVPIDAPTQPRKYLAPSATSRKEVPAVFARKRSRSTAFGDAEEDELDEAQEPLAPTATEREQIEWKRRQNTLAARKSRKRKLEHQQFLENRVADLEKTVEMWKTRALTTASILHSHGVPFQFDPEDEDM